jgi:hypothetical protein
LLLAPDNERRKSRKRDVNNRAPITCERSASTNLGAVARRELDDFGRLDDLPVALALGAGHQASGTIDASTEADHNYRDSGNNRNCCYLEMGIPVGGHDRVVH